MMDRMLVIAAYITVAFVGLVVVALLAATS